MTELKKQTMTTLSADIITKLSEIIPTELKNDTFLLYNVLRAYNKWQNDEWDAIKYIYNIIDKDDVIECLKNNVQISTIVQIYSEQDDNGNYFFLEDSNITMCNQDMLIHHLTTNIESILTYEFSIGAMAMSSEFFYLYTHYVGNLIHIKSSKKLPLYGIQESKIKPQD